VIIIIIIVVVVISNKDKTSNPESLGKGQQYCPVHHYDNRP